MDDEIPSSSSYSTMTPKQNKNRRATLKVQMKRNCLYFKANYDALFKIGSKKTYIFTEVIRVHTKPCR